MKSSNDSEWRSSAYSGNKHSYRRVIKLCAPRFSRAIGLRKRRRNGFIKPRRG